jgi:hypothetical protein
MSAQLERFGPPIWKTAYISAVGVVMSSGGLFLLVHTIRKGEAGPMLFVLLWLVGVIFSVGSQIRFVHVWPDRIETWSFFRKRSARWDELVRLEKQTWSGWGSTGYGYTLHTTNGKLIIPRDLRSIERLIGEIEKRMAGRSAIDIFDGGSRRVTSDRDELKISLAPLLWLGLGVSTVTAGWLLVEFSRNLDWLYLTFAVLFVWQIPRIIVSARFGPTEIRVRHLLHTREFDPQRLLRIEVTSAMQGNVLELHFDRERIKLREIHLAFDAVILKRRLESMYRLQERHQPNSADSRHG